MKRSKWHAFEPRSINPLTCRTCSQPKGAIVHEAPEKMVTVSFQLPESVVAEAARLAEKQGKKHTTLCKDLVLKGLGYEWTPPQPKQVIPARPGRYVKRATP